MKAIEINGNIKIFNRLPKIWEDENGVHLNFDKVEDASAYGIYDVVIPAKFDPLTQQLSNPHIDKKKKACVYDVTDKEFPYTLDEAKTDKKRLVKQTAKRLLDPTDWYVSRLSERAIEIPQEIKDERLAILDKSDAAELEIDALETIADVIKYQIVLVEPIDLLGEPLTE